MAKKNASAYEYYKKLMRDFNALEDEIQASTVQQRQVQTTFLRIKSAKSASEQRERDREAKKWEVERDEQLEAIVEREGRVRRLNQQAEELLDQEMRLEAELELLHDRQRAERMTEAVKLRQLIHDKADLLDKELTKGQGDLDYISQLIDAVPASCVGTVPDGGANVDPVDPAPSSPVRALVQNIHERRRGEFEAANLRFQQQLDAFAREQETIKHKTDEIRTRKQRALQILTSNQQTAIKEFFTTGLVAGSEDPDRSSGQTSDVIARHAPTLDFDVILCRVNPCVPPRALERLDLDKETGRREVEEAIQQAQAAVEIGADRLIDVEREIARRQKEAEALDEALDTAVLTKIHRQRLVASPWTFDSCPPELCQEAFFARDLLFEWAARAVDASERRQPDLNVITHAILSETFMREIIDETAAQLMVELSPGVAGKKGHSSMGSAFRSVFHRGKRKPQASTDSPKKSAVNK